AAPPSPDSQPAILWAPILGFGPPAGRADFLVCLPRALPFSVSLHIDGSRGAAVAPFGCGSTFDRSLTFPRFQLRAVKPLVSRSPRNQVVLYPQQPECDFLPNRLPAAPNHLCK